MKVAITGSRMFTDTEFMFSQLDEVASCVGDCISEVVYDWTHNVGLLAAEGAESKHINVVKNPEAIQLCDENVATRNSRVAQEVDLVVAFWDGKSLGTKGLLETCEELGVQCRVIEVPLPWEAK